jgi:hypothetical protein
MVGLRAGMLVVLAGCGAAGGSATPGRGAGLHVIVEGADAPSAPAMKAALQRHPDVVTRRRTARYALGGTSAFTIDRGGTRGVTVRCELSMMLASMPERALVATQRGAARVVVPDEPGSIARGRRECVAAVVDTLVDDKILPMLRVRARSHP